MKFLCAKRIAQDGTPRSAASHLGLFCLPMSHTLRDVRVTMGLVYCDAYLNPLGNYNLFFTVCFGSEKLQVTTINNTGFIESFRLPSKYIFS